MSQLPDAITIAVANTRLTLLPQRAIWWAEQKTLFVADVHLGKDATFGQIHLHLENRQTADTLHRLTHLIHTYNAEKLVILGDWIHAERGLTQTTIQQLNDWYDAHRAVKITLVMGNHDSRIRNLPAGENMAIVGEPYALAPFNCWHHPHNASDGYHLCGHLHPNIALRGKGRQQLTLPCFWQQANSIILPAFTTFSGKVAIRASASDHVYALTEQGIIRV
ncbi:MAG: ligase-associated DNA damage response endonuclease PdeM [Chloroflexota bacterium]